MENMKTISNLPIQNMEACVDKIHASIRLKKDGYKNLTCPKCGDIPFIERSLKCQGFLKVKCTCGLLNLTEKGI